MSQRNQKNKFRIPEEVEEFAKMDFKKFKKHNKGYYTKKEMKEVYFGDLFYNIPYVIDFLIRYSHRQDEIIKNAVNECLAQFVSKKQSEDFVKYIKKSIQIEGIDAIPNIELFPIVLHKIIYDINMSNATAKKEDPEAAVYDATEFYELSELILKKKLKKAKKKGIDEAVAFDVFSVVPCYSAMKYSPYFRIKSVFEILYTHAASKNLNFKDIISLLIDEDYYDVVISFALQERKDKLQKFNDKQKYLFNDISEFIFDELEQMDRKTIKQILESYVKGRKSDDANGQDSNRRFFISSLPENYENILSVVEMIKQKDPNAENYL